jgi:hypothetical protein
VGELSVLSLDADKMDAQLPDDSTQLAEGFLRTIDYLLGNRDYKQQAGIVRGLLLFSATEDAKGLLDNMKSVIGNNVETVSSLKLLKKFLIRGRFIDNDTDTEFPSGEIDKSVLLKATVVYCAEKNAGIIDDAYKIGYAVGKAESIRPSGPEGDAK